MNGSGGGATHIAKMTGLLSELYYNQDQVLLVAGGGGGSRNQQNNDVAGARWGNGGAGGGLEGIVATAYGGTGILHTCATCAAGQETTEERFGQGAGSTGQAAGGSGWQGGGSGTQKSDAGSTIGSGSGGSGYIDGIESGNTIPGNQPVPSPTGLETINGKDGDGYAKITLIDSTGSPIGVYINSAKYTARTDSLTNESATINSYHGDTLNSKITLESGIQDSEVSIAVNVYNPTSSTYYLAEPKNNNSTANSNITYTYLTDKESLEPNQNMLITFTFKYTSTADLTQNVINSIIQLVFVEHDLSFHNLETQLVSTKNSKLNVMIDNNGEDDLTGVVTYNGIAISNSVTIKKGENYKIITADTSSILSTLSADTLYILDFKITSPYGYTYKTIGVFKKETAPVSITKIETYINGTLQSNENNIYNTENTILVDNQQTNTSYQYVITVKNSSLNDSYKFRNITEILNNSSKLTYTLDIDLSDGMIINPQIEYTFTINYNYTSSSSRHIQMLFLDFKWNYKFEATEDKIISLATPETSTETTYGDFVTLDSASKLDSFCTLANCYSDNNGLIQYDEDGGMVLDFNNQILSLEIDQSMSIKDEYSLYMTFKADTNQKGIPAGSFPATAIAVSSADMKYLNWTGFYSNYLNLYSYYNGGSKRAIDYALETTGFISVDFSQYSNQKINMLITATRGGKTHVYINGELFVSFDSGSDPVDYTSATIGDLRPGRGLKFTGIIYDFALYNKALTEEEVQTNWEYANARWQITN